MQAELLARLGVLLTSLFPRPKSQGLKTSDEGLQSYICRVPWCRTGHSPDAARLFAKAVDAHWRVNRKEIIMKRELLAEFADLFARFQFATSVQMVHQLSRNL